MMPFVAGYLSVRWPATVDAVNGSPPGAGRPGGRDRRGGAGPCDRDARPGPMSWLSWGGGWRRFCASSAMPSRTCSAPWATSLAELGRRLVVVLKAVAHQVARPIRAGGHILAELGRRLAAVLRAGAHATAQLLRAVGHVIAELRAAGGARSCASWVMPSRTCSAPLATSSPSSDAAWWSCSRRSPTRSPGRSAPGGHILAELGRRARRGPARRRPRHGPAPPRGRARHRRRVPPGRAGHGPRDRRPPPGREPCPGRTVGRLVARAIVVMLIGVLAVI